MDVDKMKFSITATYDCDEGIECEKSIEMGSYKEACDLVAALESPTWIDHYYHRMTLFVDVYNEDGSRLDLTKALDGEYSWLDEEYYASDKTDASEMPKALSEFLEALKLSKDERKAKDIAALRAKIANLEAELTEAEEELRSLLEF